MQDINIEYPHANSFQKETFCNGIVPLTPEKPVASNAPLVIESSPSDNNPTIMTTLEASNSEKLSSASSQPETFVNDLDTDWPSVTSLVRRHSLSLTNRTPEKGSLAEDLLKMNYPSLKSRTSQLRSSIKDLSETLSDFNSCIESSSDEDNLKEVKMSKKGQKRVRKGSPFKENMNKKLNTCPSPQQQKVPLKKYL